MPTPLVVEKQTFTFGDTWSTAFKYDDTDFYRDGPEGLSGNLTKLKDGVLKVIPQATRAVDVIAFRGRTTLLLLEAKDFRGHRIENKRRMNSEVALEVALKVRDTVAALVGAARKPIDEFPSSQLAAALAIGKEVHVVLWVEDDSLRDDHRAKQHLDTLNGKLKEKLSWLNVRTFVLSSTVPNKLTDLLVTDLPGAGQPNP